MVNRLLKDLMKILLGRVILDRFLEVLPVVPHGPRHLTIKPCSVIKITNNTKQLKWRDECSI